MVPVKAPQVQQAVKEPVREPVEMYHLAVWSSKY